LLDISRSRINGNRYRSGFRIGLLAGVNRASSESGLSVLAHDKEKLSAVSYQLSGFDLQSVES
jgi:hypothetical protein